MHIPSDAYVCSVCVVASVFSFILVRRSILPACSIPLASGFCSFSHGLSCLVASPEVVAFTSAFSRHPLAQVRAGAVGRALHMC